MEQKCTPEGDKLTGRESHVGKGRCDIKKTAFLIAAVLCISLLILICACALLTKAEDKLNEKSEDSTAAEVTELPDSYFFEPDYDTDISTIYEYMRLNRRIYYTRDNQRQEVTGKFAPDTFAEFFYDYFSALLAGYPDADGSFDGFFSEVYLEKNGGHSRFTPQKIYDIDVEFNSYQSISAGEGDKNVPYDRYSLAVFDVRYKIYHNDGTYRKDIAGDSTIPQIVTLLVSPDGDLSINSVSYYRYITQQTGDPADGLVSLLLPLLFGALFLFSALAALLMKFIRIKSSNKNRAFTALLCASAAFLASFAASMFISSLWLRLAMLFISLCVSFSASLFVTRRMNVMRAGAVIRSDPPDNEKTDGGNSHR